MLRIVKAKLLKGILLNQSQVKQQMYSRGQDWLLHLEKLGLKKLSEDRKLDQL